MTEAERELLAVVIGHRVREARSKRDMSQGELASGIGSQSMISLIESGRQLPFPEVLELIAQRLQDSALLECARLLEQGDLTWDKISLTNEDVLLDALTSHRGRWHEVHHRLAIQLCEYFYMRGQIKVVQQICQFLLEHAIAGDSNYTRACFYKGSCALVEMDTTQAEKWLRAADEHSPTLDESLRGRLWYNLGHLFTTIDVQGVAAWYAIQSVNQFSHIQDFPRYAKALGLLGAIYGRMGRLEDALKTLELADDMASKWTTDAHDQARILASLTVVYFLLGRPDAALDLSRKALEVARQVEDSMAQTILHQVLFLHRFRTNQTEEARTEASNLLTGAYESGDVALIAYSELMSMNVLETREEKLEASLRACQVTLGTPAGVEHALAAECAASLYEQLGDATNAKRYRLAALSSYRHYVSKSSMVRHLINNLPTQLDYES